MSVLKKSGQLPPDAIILTKDEALRHQTSAIRNWDKQSEVWPLRYGIGIVAFAASAVGFYINAHYRRKLKLRSIGRITTYIPVVILPGMMSSLLHKLFVTHDILLEKTKCPVCLQVRAVGIQVAVGFVYPLFLAPFGSFMYASRHATYRLPDITTDYFGAFRTMRKLTRPVGAQLSLMFVGQALLASWFTYMEARSYYKVKEKTLEIEQRWENSLRNIQ